MEKSFFAVLGVTAIAVWLFVSTTEQHDADRDVKSARHEKAAAEFDRDFNRLATGKDDPALVKQAEDAGQQLAAKKSKQLAVDAEQGDKRRSLQADMESRMKSDGVDLDRLAEKVNSTKGN